MQKTDTIDKLATALAASQSEIPVVTKTGYNPFMKSHYATLDNVLQAAIPVLNKHGLSLMQLPSVNEGLISVTTILMHSSGQWIAETIGLPTSEERGKSLAQLAGSIITYLRRYALSSFLGIAAEEDDDGNEPVRPQTPAPRTPRPAAAPVSSIPPEFPEDFPLPDGAVVTMLPPMVTELTLEEAYEERSSDNRRYGEMDNQELMNRMRGIERGLNKSDATPEHRRELLRKREAIMLIVNDRAAQP